MELWEVEEVEVEVEEVGGERLRSCAHQIPKVLGELG